jgi:hypothetical protein
MFEAYTHPVSLKRRRILELHTHPVLVHFLQAFALTLFLMSVARLFAPAKIQGDLTSTIQVLSFLLPYFFGWSNSNRTYGRPIKISKSHNTFVETENHPQSGIFYHIHCDGCSCLIRTTSVLYIFPIYILLTPAASLCGALLGLIGGKLLDAKFPG